MQQQSTALIGRPRSSACLSAALIRMPVSRRRNSMQLASTYPTLSHAEPRDDLAGSEHNVQSVPFLTHNLESMV